MGISLLLIYKIIKNASFSGFKIFYCKIDWVFIIIFIVIGNRYYA